MAVRACMVGDTRQDGGGGVRDAVPTVGGRVWGGESMWVWDLECVCFAGVPRDGTTHYGIYIYVCHLKTSSGRVFFSFFFVNRNPHSI